jgi:NAD(P)-dependent dehydrogenase (short-subunit alcohol dehydrogenase family)
MGRVQDKVVLVTGAGRGQGEAHGRLLASEGAVVIVTDIRDDLAEAVAGEIGGEAWGHGLDVASQESWSGLFERIQARHGRLDGLVNNAGIAVMADLAATDLPLFERTVAVNQTGTFLGMAFAAKLMKQGGGGSIVNISSIAALKADPQFFAYTASKWAVRGMTRAAARTLAPDRIRVNAVFPGIIDTPMLTEAVPGLDVAAYASGVTPLGRAGVPHDVASAVLFLIADESAFVTGAELSVDGGLTA